MTRRYPRIAYHVTVGDTDMLVHKLRERAIDVVLTRWNALTQADDLEAENLYRTSLVVMADKSHPMMGRKRVTLPDLMQEQWILSPPDTFLGRVVADLFERRKLPLPLLLLRLPLVTPPRLRLGLRLLTRTAPRSRLARLPPRLIQRTRPRNRRARLQTPPRLRRTARRRRSSKSRAYG